MIISKFNIKIVVVLFITTLSSMSASTKNTQKKLSFEPDYIIVGSGAGGSVLAARLAEDKNNKVLLIEAGPDNTKEADIRNAAAYYKLWFTDTLTPEGSPSNWAFLTTSQKGKIYSYPRGTGLGGSTNHNAVIDGRGSEVIYDEWAKILGDPAWSANAVRPYFVRMEHFDVPDAKEGIHGKKGWEYVRNNKIKEEFDLDLIAAAKLKLGVPFRKDFYDNPKDISGIGATAITVHPDGTRSYAATDLLLPRYKENKAKGWNNLDILTNQLVSKVIFNGKRAVGVEVINGARAYKVDNRHKPNSNNAARIIYKAKKEVIIAAGSINTPQILLLSGIGPKADLEKLGIKVIQNLPGVGHHLLDHLETSHVYKIQKLPNKVWRTQANELAKTDPYWEQFGDKNLVNAAGPTMIMDWFSDFDARDKRNPDIHIHISHSLFRDFNFNPEIFKDTGPNTIAMANYRSVYSKDTRKNPIAYLDFLTEILKVKADTGSIMLTSTDPTEQPIIDLQLNSADEDLSRLAMAILMERKIMEQTNMQKYGIVEVFPGAKFKTLKEIKKYISDYSSIGHHIAGTAKMGSKNDPMAVTDSNGRVRGVTGLRICDASLAPSMPGYNTTKPTYMIAEVIADKIKAGH